jgi:hypothetical protein
MHEHMAAVNLRIEEGNETPTSLGELDEFEVSRVLKVSRHFSNPTSLIARPIATCHRLGPQV